jgi:hypothetical protein
MHRRELLGVLGAGTAGLVACGSASAALTGNAQQPHDEHIKTIAECAKICNQASHHCLEEMGKGSSHNELHVKSHAATMDCQEFCRVTAALMARSSSMAKYAHRACAEACRECATACEGHQDEIMKACVQACRECEKVCRQMSESAA